MMSTYAGMRTLSGMTLRSNDTRRLEHTSTTVAAIPQIITGIVNALINSIPQIIQAGVELLVSLIANLPTIIAEIVKAIPQIITGIVSALGQGVSQIAEVGANLVRGLWQGIQSLAGWIWDKVSGWISGIWDGICSFFGINSPSKEMAWVGEMLVEGLAGAIDTNGKEAVHSAEHLAEDISSVMRGLSADMTTALPRRMDLNTALHDIDTTPAIKTRTQKIDVTIPLTIDGVTLARVLSQIQWSQNAVYVRNRGIT